MNRVIRRGVFETNSSSTHSILILGGEFVADKIPLIDGKCQIYPGEFGWEVETYHDATTKASYAYTHARSMVNRYQKDPEIAAAQQRNMQEHLQMLRRVLSAGTGAEIVFCTMGAEDEYGYIDHQSAGVCEEAFASDETLRNFIFNPESELHTDNDNH